MSETDPIVLFGARNTQSGSRHKPSTHSTAHSQGAKSNVNGREIARSYSSQSGLVPIITAFNRHELNTILSVYGRKVADGEWRDYAIDHFREQAVFSIFRRTSEVPLYRVEKNPKLARKQGTYSVITATGMILRRGHDLAQVLKIID
ncbi:unnamed protein product, partial [marine sediment metagenome]